MQGPVLHGRCRARPRLRFASPASCLNALGSQTRRNDRQHSACGAPRSPPLTTDFQSPSSAYTSDSSSSSCRSPGSDCKGADGGEGRAQSLLAAAAAAAVQALAGPELATAADVVNYDNSAGSNSLRNVFGVGYAVLVGAFAIRLLLRRAKRAKSEVRRAFAVRVSESFSAFSSRKLVLSSCDATSRCSRRGSLLSAAACDQAAQGPGATRPVIQIQRFV